METTEKEIIGKRVLANNGTAVIITGDGKCKKVFKQPEVSAEEIETLTKKASGTNNKILFEKVKAVCEDAKMRKGWITAKGFRFRYAPAGFEMYDVENRMTPINLGEAPTAEEVATFIDKPRLKKITENRKPADKKPASKKEDKPVVEKTDAVAKTDEDYRKDGLKLIRKYAKTDYRHLSEIKGMLYDAVVNRKYRVQMGKMFKDYMSKRPTIQKRDFTKFMEDLKQHLTSMDFSPAKKTAPKFVGLDELKAIKFNDVKEDKVTFVTPEGNAITASMTKYLAHDILYNWPEFNVVIGKFAEKLITFEEAVANLEMRDRFYEFKKETIRNNNPHVNSLLKEIYDYLQEVSPLEFVYGTEYKAGTKVTVRHPDHKTKYKAEVVSNYPLLVRYEDGYVTEVLKHQEVSVL